MPPVEFLIFGATLAGVAIFHRFALPIAALGLAAVIAAKWATAGFAAGAGPGGLAAHFPVAWGALRFFGPLFLALDGCVAFAAISFTRSSD